MKREKRWATHNYPLLIPSELKEEYYRGEITAEQMLFLAEIQCLVQWGKSNHKKFGCHITNAGLAYNEKCSVRRIQQKIQELAAPEKGYLIITFKIRPDGRQIRYIKTCWSDAIRKAFQRRKYTVGGGERNLRQNGERNFHP